MTALAAHATILVYPVAPLDRSHAEALIKSIQSYNSSTSKDAQPSILAQDHRWRIENKYYSANVGFVIVESGEAPRENMKQEGEEPAVVVLAVRETIPSTKIHALLSTIAQRQPEFEIALLFSYPQSLSSISTTPPIDADAWEDSALDSQFEWVDFVSDREIEKETGREETGVGRVVEALQAFMWEGMLPASPPQRSTSETTEDITTVQHTYDNDEGDDDAMAILGAPPLPSPRPFIPTVLEFPSSFLPSITRSPILPQSLPPKPIIPLSSEKEEATFDDDFAPFVQSTATFPPLFSSQAISAPSSSISSQTFPEILPPDTETGTEEEPDDDEDLEKLFDRLKGLRTEAKGMSMEERRDMAERVLSGLLGE